MDLEIPQGLHWVSYLVSGDEWPGSETGCRRDCDHLHVAAVDLLDLGPDLHNVREETLSVLFGETAQAVDEQFAMLFEGDYALSKLADAVTALGDSVGYMGDVIQSLKIGIITGLTFAAAEISYHLASAPWTGGASLAWIPVTEAATRMAIMLLVARAMRAVLSTVRTMLSRTTVRQLLPASLAAGRHEIPNELAWALSEKVTADSVLAATDLHPNFTLQSYTLTTVAAGTGGAAGGGTAVHVRHGLGPAQSKLGATGKGILTMGISGGVGSATGALAVLPATGQFDPQSVLAGAALTSVGGVKGIGGPHGGGQPPTVSRLGLPPSPGSPLPQLQPFTPDDGDSAGAGPSARTPSVDGRTPVADRLGVKTTSINLDRSDAGLTNGVAAQSNLPSTAETKTAEHEPATGARPTEPPSTEPAHADDDSSQTGPPTPHSDAENLSTQSNDGATLTTDHAADDGPGSGPNPGNAVVDAADQTTDHGPVPVGGTPADSHLPIADDSAESRVEAATDRSATVLPEANVFGPPPVTPTSSTTGVNQALIPGAQVPTSSQPPTARSTPAQRPPSSTPKQTAPPNDSASQIDATSAPNVAGTPVARVSDSTVAPAEPNTLPAAAERATPEVDDQPIRPPADPTPLAVGGSVPANTPNCGVGVLRFLSGWYERAFGRGVVATSKGVLARAVYQAVNSRADFTTFADSAEHLLRPDVDPDSSGVLTWSWAGDGGRRGGHSAVIVKRGDDDVYLFDPHTNQHYRYDRDSRQFTGYWGQDAVSQMAVGFLDPDGDPVNGLDGTPNELAAADDIGYVQGHPDRGRSDPPDRLLADAALDRRRPRLWAKGLVDQFGGVDPAVAAKGMVNPLGQLDEAVARAQANAVWSTSMTGDIGDRMHEALANEYAVQVGNTWGFDAKYTDTANRIALERARARADELRSGRRGLTAAEQRFVARVDRIESGLREVDAAAAKAGLPAPHLLAFDPTEFGGNGHAVVAFRSHRDVDIYNAENVSWQHADKLLDRLGTSLVRRTVAQLRSDRRQVQSAAAILWIGKSSWLPWGTSRNEVDNAFQCDQAVVQAAREARGEIAETPTAEDVLAEVLGDVQGDDSDPVTTALNKRVPPVEAKDLVTALGSPERAAARARANALWWPNLSDTERQLLRERYPYFVGNAAGVKLKDRQIANEILRQRLNHWASQMRARERAGERLTPAQQKLLSKVAHIDVWLSYADVAAQDAGLGPVRLLALDPMAFGGDGHIVISVGANPYDAETVSWHIERQPIGKLGETVINSAIADVPLDQRDTRAAIIWIGNSTGLPWSDSRNAFYTGNAAFHAAREALSQTEAAPPVTGNSVHLLNPPPATVADPSATNVLWRPRDAGLVVAHRGDSYNYPEQTRAAFESALQAGANALECDVHLTKDGHLVVIHDRLVDRTSDSAGRVGAMTLAELQELDYGGWHPSSRLGDAQGDTGLLTLEQLVELVKNHERPVTLFIEVKHPAVGSGPRPAFEKHNLNVERAVVDLLKRHGLADPASPEQCRAAVISFFPEGLRLVRRIAPNLPTIYLALPHQALAAHRVALWAGANGVGHYPQTLRANPELPDLAAAQGLTTFAGLDDPSDLQYFLDLGVSWLNTDHPARTIEALGRAPSASDTARQSALGETATPTAEVSPGQNALSHKAVGPLGHSGDGVNSLDGTPGEPASANTGGHPDGDGVDRDPGERWRDVPRGADRGGRLARQALRRWETPLTPKKVERLCRWRGTGEQTVGEVQADARAWATLTGEQQRALIDNYPEFIGNGIGFPDAARYEANSVKLEHKRSTRNRLLQERRRRKLSAIERNFLMRMAEVERTLRNAADIAAEAGTESHLLGLSRDWRVLICYGSNGPLTSTRLSLLVDNQGSNSDALRDRLRQYDCVVDWSPNRQLRRSTAAQMARIGESQLSRDVTAYTAARNASAPEGSHPNVPRVHWVSDSSTPPPRRWPATGHPMADPALLQDAESGLAVIGHRGALIDRPELTLAGYKLALDQGAGGIECDVQLTRDGHMVVFHDAKVDRTANGTGRVDQMTLAELQALDYGAKHPSANLGEAQGDTGLVVLKDLLELVRDYPRPVQLYVETKRTKFGTRVEQELVRLLNEVGMASPTSLDESRVVVVSKWPDSLWRVRQATPNVPTALILGGEGVSMAIANRFGATAVTVNIQELRAHPDLVAKAAEFGLGVVCAGRTTSIAEVRGGMGEIGRGATTRRDAEYCRSLGVDAITVNNPGQVVNWLQPGTARHELSRNSARVVLEEFARVSGRTDIDPTMVPSIGDVPAADVYRLLDSQARPTTLAQAHAELNGWEEGSFAFFASSRGAENGGGDAWWAVKLDGEIWVYDPFTETYTKWPPYWCSDTDAHIAVGYFDNNGQPDHRLDGTPGELEAAERVGHIRGPGEEDGPTVAGTPTPEPEGGPTEPAAQHKPNDESISPTIESAVDSGDTQTGPVVTDAGIDGADRRSVVAPVTVPPMPTVPPVTLPQDASEGSTVHTDAHGRPSDADVDVPLRLDVADDAQEPVRVSGSIVLHMPSTVVGITGPVRKSVTGLVTHVGQESRTTPITTIDEAGNPRQTASITLRAVEVRGPTHIALSEALGGPGLLRIDSNDLAVHCRVQYRIFDSGSIQSTYIFADPDLNHPNFDTVRQMIDAALQDRFPGKTIEIAEMYDYGDRTDMIDRELPPRDGDDGQSATRVGEASESRSGQNVTGIGAFDFDGTIARRDTLIPFLTKTFGWPRVAVTWAAVALHTRGRDAIKVELVGRLVKGMPADKLAQLGKSYAETLPELLKPEMVEQVRWHKSQGHAVVLVSASLAVYLVPIAEELGIDAVLGVEMEADESGILTGNVVGGQNTRGQHKVTRLESWMQSHGVQPDIELWAYGDSAGDVELLARADHPTWVGRRATEQSGPAEHANFGRVIPGYPESPHRQGNNAVDGQRADDDTLYADPRTASPRKRILVFGMSWGTGTSGAETLNMELCRGLVEAGHEVYVRAATMGTNAVVPQGVTVIGPRDQTPSWPLYSALVADSDWPESVDLVISHSQSPGLAAVHIAEQRYPDARCIHVVHHLPRTWNTLKAATGRGWAEMAADIYLARRTHLMSGLGPTLADEALQSSSMGGRAAIHELRPGLTMADQPPLPPADAPQRVLLFGRLDDPLKGAQETARMVAERRIQGHDTRLVMLGYDRAMLQAAGGYLAMLAADPNAVEVRPRTSNPAELKAIIRSATVVVMPSRAEGFGLVATEAIEQGVPVVVASGSGVGRFLSGLPGYREAALTFNLAEQDLAAPPSPAVWRQRLDVVLGDLPAAWANAQLLQEQLLPFTRRQSAEDLVDAALTAPDRPAPPQGSAARTRVKVIDGQLIVYPHGDEVTDHDLIIAVADAMETDAEVRDLIFDDRRDVFVRQARPMDDFYAQAIDAVFGRELSAFVTEPIPAEVVSAALRGESDAQLRLDAMVAPGIRDAMRHVVAENMADLLTENAVNRTALPRGVDQNQDALSAALGAYRASAREELLNYFGTRPELLESGTVDQVTDWLLRRWAVGLAGFDNANPAATRQLIRGLDHVLLTYRQIVVREGMDIRVGNVAGGNGVEMVGRRDDAGRMVIESITVDPGCLFGAIPPGQRLDSIVYGAVGGVLVDAGDGIADTAYWHLLQHFNGLRSDPGAPPLALADSAEGLFESAVREQLGERAMPAVTRADQVWGHAAASQRFDANQAARAAMYQVTVRGWDNASDLARALYRLLFAQVRGGE